MVVVFTPLEGVASASHRIDKSRHLSDGTARTLSFARKQCAFSPKLLITFYLQVASMKGKEAEVVAAAEAAIAAAETRVAPLRDPALCITHSMDIADKVGELEERARRLAREEVEEIRRGRELNIITTPVHPTK